MRKVRDGTYELFYLGKSMGRNRHDIKVAKMKTGDIFKKHLKSEYIFFLYPTARLYNP